MADGIRLRLSQLVSADVRKLRFGDLRHVCYGKVIRKSCFSCTDIYVVITLRRVVFLFKLYKRLTTIFDMLPSETAGDGFVCNIELELAGLKMLHLGETVPPKNLRQAI